MDNAKVSNYEDYQPLTLNLGVWFSAVRSDSSSLSLNMTRGYLTFNFTQSIGSEKKKINKMVSMDQIIILNELLKTIVARRLDSIKNNVTNLFVYEPLGEEIAAINTNYYDKASGEFKTTGKITFKTIEIDNINRIAITVYDNIGDSKISVVIGNTGGYATYSTISPGFVIDSYDAPLYRLSYELDSSIKNTLIYAGFDKIYQKLNNKGDKIEKKESFSLFQRKNEPHKAITHDTPEDESDRDLFS